MGSDAMKVMVDSELAAFASLAGGLTSEQWESPSLCDAWTVRDVVVHSAYHTHRGVKETFGSQEKSTARLVERAHAETIEGLRSWLASPAPDSIRRSGINLSELVIHQQDVRRPLGVPREYPEATLRTCLDFCTTFRGNLLVLATRRGRAHGLRLVATDMAWSKGTGPAVTGPGEALLMAVAGRPAALADLSGPGVGILAERLDMLESLPV